jgi:N-glycosylase/DNA lyase
MEIRLDEANTPLNLEHTLSCGQIFRWEKIGDWWYGVVGEKAVKVRQVGGMLLFQGFPEKVDAHFIESYFRLDDDLPLVLSQINKDRHIDRAIQTFYGLRIIRQEPWECLISYMCATNANIPAIRNMVLNLSKKFGRKITLDNHDFHAFPKAKDVAQAKLEEIKKCKLGFRAEHVLEVSRMIEEKEFDLEALRNMGYEEAKGKLMSLPGVGHKVADCILLFSLDKLEAFPVDVWMKRLILKLYTDHFEQSFIEKVLAKRSITPKEYEKISSFGRNYFGEYAGYAQEYLFHSRGRQL